MEYLELQKQLLCEIHQNIYIYIIGFSILCHMIHLILILCQINYWVKKNQKVHIQLDFKLNLNWSLIFHYVSI